MRIQLLLALPYVAVCFATEVHAHPDICETQVIIIYAWNEHDEGGWLVVTWQKEGSADNRRLEAIWSVLCPESIEHIA